MNSAILTDAASCRFARWGRSTTLDEHMGKAVLPAPIVRSLHALAGLATDGSVGNAGLIHLYGYLLSTAETPYGPKHARWTGGGVARALGLAPEALLPDATRDASGRTPLATLTPIVERLLAEPPAGAVVVDEAGEGLAARTVLLDSAGGALAVYGVGTAAPVLPITVFPIRDVAATIAEIEGAPPGLRYNAVDAEGRARTPLATRRVSRAAPPPPSGGA